MDIKLMSSFRTDYLLSKQYRDISEENWFRYSHVVLGLE